MKMVSVKVLKAHPYGHETRKPGQICVVQKEHVAILTALGLVKLDDSRVVKIPIKQADAVESEKQPKVFVDTDTVGPEEDPEKKRRTYRRRDLQAEE